MIKTVTFGYRWEGLMLHQWAFTHTDLQAVIIPWNRMEKASMCTEWGQEAGINWTIQREDNIDFLEEYILTVEPDLIICHCYSLKIPNGILSIPKYGCINIHPGALPEFKGPRPIEDALRKNRTYLGVTIHYMTNKIDSGGVIITSEIKADSNLQRMRLKLAEEGLRLLDKWLPDIKAKGEKLWNP